MTLDVNALSQRCAASTPGTTPTDSTTKRHSPTSAASHDASLLREQTRHRLNQGGDRQANAALHRIAVVGLCREQRTQEYVARRQREGKTKREAIRCIKRYIAREVYKILRDNPHLAPA